MGISAEARELSNYIISSTTTEPARAALIDAGLDHVGGGAAISELVRHAARQYAREHAGGAHEAEIIFSGRDYADAEFALAQWVVEEIEAANKPVASLMQRMRA